MSHGRFLMKSKKSSTHIRVRIETLKKYRELSSRTKMTITEMIEAALLSALSRFEAFALQLEKKE